MEKNKHEISFLISVYLLMEALRYPLDRCSSLVFKRLIHLDPSFVHKRRRSDSRWNRSMIPALIRLLIVAIIIYMMLTETFPLGSASFIWRLL